jgi:hypothetical protein
MDLSRVREASSPKRNGKRWKRDEPPLPVQHAEHIKALAKIHHEDEIYTIHHTGETTPPTWITHESECFIKEAWNCGQPPDHTGDPLRRETQYRNPWRNPHGT